MYNINDHTVDQTIMFTGLTYKKNTEKQNKNTL